MRITVRNFPRLDENGIKEMANGIITGGRYIYPLASKFEAQDTVVAAAWLGLGVTFTEAAAKQVGAIVGSMERVLNSINGLPVTWSGWIVHRDDWAKVVERLRRIEEAMEA